MKTVYFIRHGQSDSNAGGIQREHDSVLTEKGKEQAVRVAQRCAHMPCDVIISSTFPRAKDTAEIINETINVPIEFSDVFVERRRPSAQIGLHRDDPVWLQIEQEEREHFHQEGYRHSDEEGFEELRDRAQRAYAILEAREEEHIVVVTHGFFMRMMMAHLLFGEAVTRKEAMQCMHAFHMTNTGMTVIKYDERNRVTPWFLWVWNDHAHLETV